MSEVYNEAYWTSDDVPNDYGPDVPYTWEHREGQMRATLKDLEHLCLPFSTVLDAGCGTGLFIRALTEEGYEAQGVDVSDWAVTNADAQVKGRVHKGDICDMRQHKDRSFDLVACLDTLEHLTHEQVVKAMTEIFRIADREVVIRVPCARPLEWMANPQPEALAGPSGDDSHTMVVQPQYWEWQITKRGWLLSSRVHHVGLCMLPRNTYFVARRPEFQYRTRDEKWEDK